jgi:hypothetical protein
MRRRYYRELSLTDVVYVISVTAFILILEKVNEIYNGSGMAATTGSGVAATTGSGMAATTGSGIAATTGSGIAATAASLRYSSSNRRRLSLIEIVRSSSMSSS